MGNEVYGVSLVFVEAEPDDVDTEEEELVDDVFVGRDDVSEVPVRLLMGTRNGSSFSRSSLLC